MTDLHILKLSEFLTSRLLHDMVGPINALVSSIDLSEEQPELHDEMQTTIKKSSRVIMSRLKFYRLCFGQGGYVNLQKPELERIITDYLYFEPIKLTWKGHDSAEHLNKWGKLILHMVFHYSQALIRGGQIDINLTGDPVSGSALFIGQGDRPLLQNTSASILTSGIIPKSDINLGTNTNKANNKDKYLNLNTTNAPALFTYLLSQKMNIKVEYEEPLTFTLKQLAS